MRPGWFPLLISYALWAAFVATVVVVGVVLLRACGLLAPLSGVLPGLGWNFCRAAPSALSAEAGRGEELGKLARRLELELARKNLECASLPLPPAQPAPAKPPPQAAEAKPLAPSPPTPDPVLKIPDKPAEDYAFLKGCWRTDPFKHTPSHQPGVSTYCFDDKGNGQLEYQRPGQPGYVCRTTAQARFEGQQLRIRDADASCSDGGQWYADVLNCERAQGDVAQCSGSANTPAGPHTWTVRMNRVP